MNKFRLFTGSLCVTLSAIGVSAQVVAHKAAFAVSGTRGGCAREMKIPGL